MTNTAPGQGRSAEIFFIRFFATLEERGIPYVVLHSYEKLPGNVDSDVDYCVPSGKLNDASAVLRAVAADLGWLVVQKLQHEAEAFYLVAIDPANPAEFVKLDGCSHFLKGGHPLLSDSVLMQNRRKVNGFWVPCPSSEFIYLLAKALGKRKDLAQVQPRLQALWNLEPERSAELLPKLLGSQYSSFEKCKSAISGSTEVRTQMLGRHKPSWKLRLAEASRILRRIMQPTGLHVAFLGPDGVGKSTLIANIGKVLEPCFRREQLFHFRPMTFENPQGMAVSNPHGMAPRSTIASFCKLLFYFFDNWSGYLMRVIPMRKKSTLVIFDRNYVDMLIDPRRYRLHLPQWITRCCSALMPRPDLTFVLVGNAEVIHARKPELQACELERQCEELRHWVFGNPDAIVIDADAAPDRAAAEVASTVIQRLAQRASSYE